MYAYLLRIGYKPRNELVAVRWQATRFSSQLHQKRKSESSLDLLVNPHASLVAREEGVSFSKVWRLAERERIDLAAGREAKGYKRFSAERRAMPTATQAEIAEVTGVSRPTVTRIEGGRRRKLAVAKAETGLRT
jgi:CRP-like cAMP-binding protein